MERVSNNKYWVFRVADGAVLLMDVAVKVEMVLFSEHFFLLNEIPDHFHTFQELILTELYKTQEPSFYAKFNLMTFVERPIIKNDEESSKKRLKVCLSSVVFFGMSSFEVHTHCRKEFKYTLKKVRNREAPVTTNSLIFFFTSHVWPLGQHLFLGDQ